MEKICPMTRIIDVLSKKWTLWILRQLNDNDRKRFNELAKEISNISSRALSQRLKELEANGLVSKERFNEIPPRVEYSLTGPGKELIKCFGSLDDWVKKHGKNILDP